MIRPELTRMEIREEDVMAIKQASASAPSTPPNPSERREARNVRIGVMDLTPSPQQ